MIDNPQDKNTPVALSSTSAGSEAADLDSPGGSPVRLIIGVSVGLIALILVGFIVAFILALTNPGAAQGVQIIRDFFIIALALEGILMGVALIVLILQIARLTNLLQNEIKPILEQTNTTVRTVKGTAAFVSRNVAEPVIKASGFVAWLGAVLSQVFAIARTRR